MTAPVINLITPPDKLFNDDPSILLVNPNDNIKNQMNEVLKDLDTRINLYLYDKSETADQTWLIDIANSVNSIIVDIDNTHDEQWLIGYLLSFSKTFYLTNRDFIPYNVINTNRIYDVKQVVEGGALAKTKK